MPTSVGPMGSVLIGGHLTSALCRAHRPWCMTTVSMAVLGTVTGTLAPVGTTPQKAASVPNTKSCWTAAVSPRRPALSVLGRMESDISSWRPGSQSISPVRSVCASVGGLSTALHSRAPQPELPRVARVKWLASRRVQTGAAQSMSACVTWSTAACLQCLHVKEGSSQP